MYYKRSCRRLSKLSLVKRIFLIGEIMGVDVRLTVLKRTCYGIVLYRLQILLQELWLYGFLNHKWWQIILQTNVKHLLFLANAAKTIFIIFGTRVVSAAIFVWWFRRPKEILLEPETDPLQRERERTLIIMKTGALKLREEIIKGDCCLVRDWFLGRSVRGF